MKKGIKLIFETETGLCAEEITVYGGPLENGEVFIVENAEIFLPEAAEGSVYSYELNWQGSYIHTGVIEFTGEDAARGEKVVHYALELRRDDGFETAFVSRWTDAVETRCYNMDSLRGFDKSVPCTPAFSAYKGVHQFTSAKESLEFLKETCKEYRGVYLYELKEQGGCPAVIFTKEHLDNGKPLDEALQRIAADGRLKALYQAQLHGNEPASGEGALATVQKLVELYDRAVCTGNAFKKNRACGGVSAEEDRRRQFPDLPEVMDIVILPFVNENGSREFSRWETVCSEESSMKEVFARGAAAGKECEGETCKKLDLNRDALLLRSEVTRAIHRIFCVLMPEVFIDAHEFSGRKRQVREENGRYILDSLDDIQITCVDHLNRDSRIFELENRIMTDTIDSLSAKGFRSFFFPGAFSQNTSCGYARLMYALTFLVESNGIRRGKLNYARRVLSQREAVLEILFKAAEKADVIREQVDAARRDFVKRGGVFDEEDIFVLEQKADESRAIERPRKSFDFAGNVIDADRKAIICNRGEAVRGRIRPAGYVLPKDCPGAERAVEILTANGAVYEELKEGEPVWVERYLRKGTEIVLDCAEKRSFEGGAYVFSLQQMAANVISASLEPDLGDVTERNGSFVQAGILSWDGDVCPVYRKTFTSLR